MRRPGWCGRLVLLVSVALCGCAGQRLGGQDRPAHAMYPSGAVAADAWEASEAGAEMLRRGGNAVDAGVASSFTLSVVRPYSCGIGGGGFMLLYLRPEAGGAPVMRAINYREVAPGAMGPDYFEGKPEGASERGGASVGVPGTVAGLLHALERYGTMDRATVLAPAIRAARDGFIADEHFVRSASEIVSWYRAAPGRTERFPFVWERYLKRGTVAQGDRIRVPEQAVALELIRERGVAGFYEGPVASAVVDAVRRTGGDLTLDDLRSYRVVDGAPLLGSFGGRTMLTMPPPSSGGITMQQAMGIIERAGGFGGASLDDPAYAHRLVEGLKHAFADRARWLGDPAYVEVPVGPLLDPAYLGSRAAMFDPDRTLATDAYGTASVPVEDGGTSHVSVVDRFGNAVACTETINLRFGSMVGVAPFGIVLNDEMDDFLSRRGTVNAFGLTQSERNLPAPGKRPLSSMSPMIVLDGPDPSSASVEVVAGASGGPRIITGTLQVVLNVLVHGMSAFDAVAAARVHHQWQPDAVFLEPSLRGTPIESGLAARGHEIRERPEIGVVQVIRRARVDGVQVWDAASDPRKGGRPAGH